MVGHLVGGWPLPGEVVDHIVAKADGVPLYVEELTKAILGSRMLEARGDAYVLTGALAQLHIPETLQGSLMARLDRAPRLREVAQLGSVLGREFSYDMISALAGLEEDMLQSGLGQLVVGELLYQRGRPPRSRYLFKHALIQDAAYQSLLRRTRQQYHERVATLLEDRFPEMASTQPELVAHHHTEANCPAQAIAYWHKAGLAAASKSSCSIRTCISRIGRLPTPALPTWPTTAQAAIRAGYSAKSARVVGCRNITKANIAAAIEAQNKRAERTELTQDWVLEELRKIAGANMADYMKSTTPEGEPYLDFSTLTRDQTGQPGAPATDNQHYWGPQPRHPMCSRRSLR